MKVSVEYVYEAVGFVCVYYGGLYYKVPTSKVQADRCFNNPNYRVDTEDLVDGSEELTYDAS